MEWPLIGREADLNQAVGLVESGTGIAVLGPAGVGKSRLLHELVGRAQKAGIAVVRAIASATTRTIPFAPFAELLPDGATEDRLAMLRSARRSLDQRRSQHGLLLAIDDAHHLDETSLAFLLETVGHGSALVSLTARAGEPMAPDLVDLWTNGVIARIDLEPLDRTESRRLVEATLGSFNPDLEEELWELSSGNPLLMHELVEGAMGGAMTRRDDGTWMLSGALAESARLGDLVASRLRALPDDLREAMAAVALGNPLPLPCAERIAGSALGDLEERGLVVVSGDDDDRVVVPGHPIYGEVLAANLPESRRQTVFRRLTDAAIESNSVMDPLQVAVWQSRSGALVSSRLALDGADEALVRHDPALAERLVRRLGEGEDRARLILGRALSYQQRFQDAEDVLASVSAGSSPLHGEVASIRAQNLGFGLRKVPRAKEVLEAAASRIEDADLRARLVNERAMVSAIHGDFADAMSASEDVLSDEATSVVPRAAAYVTLTVALAMTGDCDRMDEVVGPALDVTSQARGALPFALDQVEIMQMVSCMNAGRLDMALQLCDRGYRRGGKGDAMTTTWLSAIGLAQELTGRLRTADRAAEQALALFSEFDPFGLELQARGVLAAVRGQRSDPDPGRTLDGLGPVEGGARLTIWVDRGRAWTAAVHGDLGAAAHISAEGGRKGIAGEHYAWALLCFLDTARFGRPDLVIDDVRGIDASRGAHLLAAMKGYVEALHTGAGPPTEESGALFGELGANLLAAEAYAEAAARHEAEGDLTAAARCSAVSIGWEQRCEGPATPSLGRRPDLVTEREVEVAALAAARLTSPEISDRLYISVRTVDNHLSSVYRKLQVQGRDGLATVFGGLNE